MIVSVEALRKDTVDLIKKIDSEIQDIESFRKNEGDRLGAQMRGAEEVSFRLATLMNAKATAYNTLVMLQTGTNAPGRPRGGPPGRTR